MKFLRPPAAIAAVAGIFLSSTSPRHHAHGSGHEQIAELTKALEDKPGDPQLLLMRAAAHRMHADWAAAMRDLDAAEKAGASAGAVALARAGIAVEEKRWSAAEKELPTLARECAANPEAWRLAGRILAAQRRGGEAIVAWQKVIETASPARPQDFIELARMRETHGASDAAIADLAAGIAALGELTVFLEEILRIEVGRARWEAALKQIDRLLAPAPNSPRWLAKKAEIFTQAKQPTAATEARRAALSAIEALPPSRRSSPAFVELENELRRALAD